MKTERNRRPFKTTGSGSSCEMWTTYLATFRQKNLFTMLNLYSTDWKNGKHQKQPNNSRKKTYETDRIYSHETASLIEQNIQIQNKKITEAMELTRIFFEHMNKSSNVKKMKGFFQQENLKSLKVMIWNRKTWTTIVSTTNSITWCRNQKVLEKFEAVLWNQRKTNLSQIFVLKILQNLSKIS